MAKAIRIQCPPQEHYAEQTTEKSSVFILYSIFKCKHYATIQNKMPMALLSILCLILT